MPTCQYSFSPFVIYTIPLSYMYMHLHTETYIYAGLDPKFLGSFFVTFKLQLLLTCVVQTARLILAKLASMCLLPSFPKEQHSQPGCSFSFCIKWGHSSEQHDSPKTQNCCPWLFGSLVQSCLRKRMELHVFGLLNSPLGFLWLCLPHPRPQFSGFCPQSHKFLSHFHHSVSSLHPPINGFYLWGLSHYVSFLWAASS